MTKFNIGAFVSTQFGNVNDTFGSHTMPAKVIAVKVMNNWETYMVQCGDRVGIATIAPPHIEADLYCASTFLTGSSAQDWVSIKTVQDAAQYWSFELPLIAA